MIKFNSSKFKPNAFATQSLPLTISKDKAVKNKSKQVKGGFSLLLMLVLVSCNPPQTAIPAPPATVANTPPPPSATSDSTLSPSAAPSTTPGTTSPSTPPPGVAPSAVPPTVSPSASPPTAPSASPSGIAPTAIPAGSDQTAPTVTQTLPAQNAIDVPINFKPTVTFSEAMDPLTISSATYSLTAPDTTAVAGQVSFVDQTASFTPTSNLMPNTIYTAKISTGSKDLAGNALTSDFVWSFTTGAESDVLSPTVISSLPINGAIDVPLTVQPEVTFSEAMDPLTFTSSSYSLKNGITTVVGELSYLDSKAIFKPSASLEADTEYTATIKSGSTGVKDLAGNALSNDFVWTFKTIAESGNTNFGPASVNLGNISPYGVLSNTSVTLGGAGLRVGGDVGIFPAGACNGCDSNTVSGVIAIGAAAEPAMASLQSAYDDAIGRTLNKCTLVDAGSLVTNPPPVCGGTSNGVFEPGLYWSGSSIQIPAGGTITLDGKNNPNSVFIFQSESTINTIGGNTHMILINQAKAKNIYWVAKSSATIGGTTSDFAGTVLALVAVTVNTGTQMNGRALARSAAVTVQADAVITVPAP